MEKEQIITLTKALAKAMQETDEYLALLKAKEDNDNDSALQDLIGQLNLKKLSLGNLEDTSENQEKIQRISQEAEEIYHQIMENTHMRNYTAQKEKMNAILADIDYIINSSANGANPDDIVSAPSCSGSCSSCGGCHH